MKHVVAWGVYNGASYKDDSRCSFLNNELNTFAEEI